MIPLPLSLYSSQASMLGLLTSTPLIEIQFIDTIMKSTVSCASL